MTTERRKNMKKTLITFIVSVLLITAVSASFMIPASERAKEVSKAPLNSPVIDEMWGLERIDFVHYAKPVSSAKPPKTSACYKLMGVKWSTLPVSYVINTDNSQGLTAEFITSTISKSAENWDDSTSSELFNDAYSTSSLVHYGIYDGINAIEFAPYSDNNAIAVTSVWYTRVGKKILEFDMIFNSNYAWGNSDLTSNVMDLENIATHELGHAVGLSDIYTTSCDYVTMYGYSWYGDIEKRTLEAPDITGLQSMYG
jgi:hypothetical protein